MRAALISGVRKANNAIGSAVSRQRIAADITKKAPAFSDLADYEAIKIQLDLTAKIGIRNPFYQLQGMRAGVETEVDGTRCINFTSYDYLNLNADPRIVSAVAEAAAKWGTSVSASRLTSGERACHRALEDGLARLYEADAALVFVSGHATNIAVLGTLLGPKDLILHDVLSHNSILVGAQLSGAHRVNFPHNDMDALDSLLKQHRRNFRHCIVVTEGLFSMDGDGPDMGRLVEIKNRHGAWLMIDEAHSLGVLGATGRGLFEHCGLPPGEVDIWMGTLSKTLVSCGGYVAGSQALIDFLKYRAPGMVYSVGLPATAAVAASTALELMLAEPERVRSLQRNGSYFLEKVRDAGLDAGTSWGYAVTPVILGDSLRTVLLADRLMKAGFAAVPVFPPGVPERMARLRFFISAGHTAAQIDRLVEALMQEKVAIERSGPTVSSIAIQTVRSRLAANKPDSDG